MKSHLFFFVNAHSSNLLPFRATIKTGLNIWKSAAQKVNMEKRLCDFSTLLIERPRSRKSVESLPGVNANLKPSTVPSMLYSSIFFPPNYVCLWADKILTCAKCEIWNMTTEHIAPIFTHTYTYTVKARNLMRLLWIVWLSIWCLPYIGNWCGLSAIIERIAYMHRIRTLEKISAKVWFYGASIIRWEMWCFFYMYVWRWWFIDDIFFFFKLEKWAMKVQWKAKGFIKIYTVLYCTRKSGMKKILKISFKLLY